TEDRGVDDAGDELVADGHADRDAEQRQPGGEVAGAVDRIDVEAHHRLRGGARGGRLGGALPALLADDPCGGQQAPQLGDDDVLAGAVVLGDDVVAGGLVLAGEAVAVQASQVLGGAVRGGERDVEQVRGRGHGGRGGRRRGVHPRQASPPWSDASAVHTARTGPALPGHRSQPSRCRRYGVISTPSGSAASRTARKSSKRGYSRDSSRAPSQCILPQWGRAPNASRERCTSSRYGPGS